MIFNCLFLFRADNDPWDWLAKLMNILEAFDDKSIEFENEMKEGEIPLLFVYTTDRLPYWVARSACSTSVRRPIFYISYLSFSLAL